MDFLWSISEFVKYFFRAKTKYRLHSPMAYELAEILYQKTDHNKFQELERWRTRLLNSKDKIKIIDYGAGSKKGFAGSTSIARLANASLSSPAQARQLYNICRWQKPHTILELGTSFGISSAYLQLACPEAEIVTIEGNPEIAAYARKFLIDQFETRSPLVVEGAFGKMLPNVLESLKRIDLVFIDGDHSFEGTISNFQRIFPFLHEGSVVILHDLYWSRNMKKAWKFLRQMTGTRVSFDLYHMGILFFTPKILEKQHFSLIAHELKPWSIGLFK